MEFIRAQGKEIYAGESPLLLRGFGLGGWFLPEGYMWKLYQKCDRPRRMEAMIEKLCGQEYAESFWESYLEGYITKADIEFIAKEGFNSIRLPLNGRHLYYQSKDGSLSINDRMFRKIDEVVAWCRTYGIYIILDMHGAPGGQTGQNIDDSEADQPELFIHPQYEEELIFLWKKLAGRYADEPVIAGYDLLNEPLPNFFSQYNERLLPLYRRLIQEIRSIDRKHMIILEGLHWATDFSVFDQFTKEEASDNIMLQFHKYWSNPDKEGLADFIRTAESLSVPLFMGEGGENNCDWYTTAFPLYETLNISWNFWSYKKMACSNSPMTFDIPEGWNSLIDWISGAVVLDRDKAIEIFDNFLACIRNARINRNVLKALKRETPVRIPGEAYQDYRICSARTPGAVLRMTDPVSILFESGKTGEVNYRGYGGEEQPEEENLVIRLSSGDSLGYLFVADKPELHITITAGGIGSLKLTVTDKPDGSAEHSDNEYELISINNRKEYRTSLMCDASGYQKLWLTCETGTIQLDYLCLE